MVGFGLFDVALTMTKFDRAIWRVGREDGREETLRSRSQENKVLPEDARQRCLQEETTKGADQPLRIPRKEKQTPKGTDVETIRLPTHQRRKSRTEKKSAFDERPRILGGGRSAKHSPWRSTFLDFRAGDGPAPPSKKGRNASQAAARSRVEGNRRTGGEMGKSESGGCQDAQKRTKGCDVDPLTTESVST